MRSNWKSILLRIMIKDRKKKKKEGIREMREMRVNVLICRTLDLLLIKETV